MIFKFFDEWKRISWFKSKVLGHSKKCNLHLNPHSNCLGIVIIIQPC